MRVYWQEQYIELNKSCIVLIAPQTNFTPELSMPTDHCYIHFLCGRPFDGLSDNVVAHHIHAPRRKLLDNIFHDATEHTLPTARQHLSIMTLVGDLLSEFPEETWAPPSVDAHIEHTRQLMDSRPGNKWKNDQLARVAHLTPNAFNRRFKQVVGLTPQTYLLNRRIEAASTRLEHSSDSIDDIAEACGFASRSHFSTVFKQQTGMGPASFRKKSQR